MTDKKTPGPGAHAISGCFFIPRTFVQGLIYKARESALSPTVISRLGIAVAYAREHSPLSVWRFEIWFECQDLCHRCEASGQIATHAAGPVCSASQAQQAILGELLTGQALERFFSHPLRPDPRKGGLGQHLVGQVFILGMAARLSLAEHLPDNN